MAARVEQPKRARPARSNSATCQKGTKQHQQHDGADKGHNDVPQKAGAKSAIRYGLGILCHQRGELRWQ